MKHCLVVDDSALVRKVAGRIIESLGYTVAEADDGISALDACRQSMPDLILLDLVMPVMDGFSFMSALKIVPGSDKARIVICTTQNDVGQIARAYHEGVATYVMKPFDREVLTGQLTHAGLA